MEEKQTELGPYAPLRENASENLTRLNTGEPPAPWWFSEERYFTLACSVGFLPSIFALSTISIYNSLFEGLLYSFYVLLCSKAASLSYGFFIPVVRLTSFVNQVKLTFVCGIGFTVAIGFIGIFFPGKRQAFYAILALGFVAITICCAGLSTVIESLRFYPKTVVGCYLSGYAFLGLLFSLLLLPMSYLRVDKSLQILVVLVVAAGIFVYAFKLHGHIASTAHYQQSMQSSHDLAQRTTFRELVAEGSAVKVYFCMLLLIVTSYSMVFPAMTSELNPPFISFSTWMNIVGIMGYAVNFLTYKFELRRLSSDAVQHTLVPLTALYVVYQSLLFCAVLQPTSWSWVVVLLFGGVFVSFQIAYYQRFAMENTVEKTEKRAIAILMNGGIVVGFFLGGLISTSLAEVRQARKPLLHN